MGFTRKPDITIVSIVLVICVGLTLYLYDPAKYVIAPKCPFKLITGLSCPGCGVQRFIHASLHGEWHKGISYNYFLIYALPYLLLLYLAWALPHGRYKIKLNNILTHKYMIWFYIITFFLWMIIRNIYKI